MIQARSTACLSLALIAALALHGCNNGDEVQWRPVRGGFVTGSAVTEGNEAEFYGADQSSPERSVGTYIGSNFVVFGGLFTLSLVLFVLHKRRAKLEESWNPNAPLQDGVAVVFGRVETEDCGPAVRLEIAQVGREWREKNHWKHV